MNIRISEIPASLTLALCLASSAAYSQQTVETSPDSEDSSATAGPDATSSATASVIISRDVVVTSGDTLTSIAARELGKAGYAPQLAEFNALVTTAPLVPGNIIRIPIHVPARGEFAQVVFAKGNVTASRAGTALAQTSNAQDSTFALDRDSEVHSGDRIFTGTDGYVSIEFSSGSVVNMQPGTEAILSRLNCLPGDDSCVIEIQTFKGKVTSNVERRDDQPVDFRISTPYASAAVRGTVFDIDASDQLLVGVTEGSVDITTAQANVGLPTGYGSVVEEGEAPSPPIALLPAPVLKRVPVRIAPEDVVTWWPFSDAQTYNAQVATDEAGNETLASYQINTAQITFDSLDAGEYYLQMRGVDQNGLQGFRSNTPITIANIDSALTPVVTSITRQGSEFLVQVQNPPAEAAGFEIQIADNEAFEDPLSVDVNATGSAVFRLNSDRVFSRARILVTPQIVSAFGDISSSDD